MTLDEKNFYEKKIINKRKKLILEGKDPDEIDEILERRASDKSKKKKNKVAESAHSTNIGN